MKDFIGGGGVRDGRKGVAVDWRELEDVREWRKSTDACFLSRTGCEEFSLDMI